MPKYCSNCVKKIDDDTQGFCENCGASLFESESKKDYALPILGLIGGIILFIVVIGLITGGFGLFGESTSISFISESPISNSGNFTVELTANGQGISGKEVTITFKNDKNSSEFKGVTDNAGMVNIVPNIEDGDYDVEVKFAGDKGYASTSASKNYAVETRIVDVDSEITSTRTEPDYGSFSFSPSFEETDKDGDGYVYLSDMNMAHTPENIINQMFADSDDDNDGRLNHDEYNKFMYNLNYNRNHYGLWKTVNNGKRLFFSLKF